MSNNTPSVWDERIDSANKYYDKWATKYKCKVLEEYYRGFQWKSHEGNESEVLAYTLNMVMATLEIKLASFSFQNIQFSITPKPAKSSFDIETAAAAAQLKEDALNMLVGNPDGSFCDEIEAAIQDSFFRFGIIEAGYSANWLTNPNAEKPLYITDLDPNASPTDDPVVVKQPDRIPQNELIFFKHIPAARFRVGGIEGRYLKSCNWFGYYDFYYADDIKSAPNLQNTKDIETVSHRSPEWEASLEFDTLLKGGDLLEIWKLWDLRAKQIILYDRANNIELYRQPFERINVFDLRWLRDFNGWYPIPPVFHWISPQDELNESRQQMRSYRRRFTSQQYAIDGQVDPEELDKYEEGKDGAIIKIKKEGAIGPIQKDSLTNVVPEAMVVGKGDLVLISGTSSESMGQADRITATQSLEISKRFAVRESREQVKVANWICKIGREGLMLAQEKLIEGLWIKSRQTLGESILGEVQLNPYAWKYVLSQDISDGVDFDVNVQLTSMSPIANDVEKQKLLEFLATLKNFPEIALSPLLIREAAYRIGYRNEKVIRELQATSLLSSLGQMAQGQQPGQAGSQTAQQIVANQTPNDNEQIRQQLTQQLTPSGRG